MTIQNLFNIIICFSTLALSSAAVNKSTENVCLLNCELGNTCKTPLALSAEDDIFNCYPRWPTASGKSSECLTLYLGQVF